MIVDTLQKLLEEEPSRILIDTFVIYVEEPLPAEPTIFLAKTYEDMDMEELHTFKEIAEHYTEILDSDKILVVPEVVSEWERFERSFSRHKNLMRNIHTHRKLTPVKRSHHSPYRRMQSNDLFEESIPVYRQKRQFGPKKSQKPEQFYLFKDAWQLMGNIRRILDSHLLTVYERSLYDDIIDLIIELDRVNHLKGESHPKWRHSYLDLHTDETIVGASLYLAITDKEPITIATSDTDISRLLGATFNLIYSVNSGQSCQLIERLRETPVKICYLPAYESCGRQLTTASFEPYNITVYGNNEQESAYMQRVEEVARRLMTAVR